MAGELGCSGGCGGRRCCGEAAQADAVAVPSLVMRRAHDEKLRMCATLERIADALPDDVDRIECLRIANALVPTLRRIHRYEEDVVFPAYQSARGGAATGEGSIRRLHAEHVEDECFADEVTEILMSLGHGRPVENAEAVGFMLRGLFETMRRHIAFEAEHILPAMEDHRF